MHSTLVIFSLCVFFTVMFCEINENFCNMFNILRTVVIEFSQYGLNLSVVLEFYDVERLL